MGLTDKVGTIAQKVQEGTKTTSVWLLTLFFRIVTGLMIGLTLSLIGQELFDYGSFSVIFLSVLFLALFLKVSQEWTFPKILLFDLITFLVALLMKMYIQLAP